MSDGDRNYIKHPRGRPRKYPIGTARPPSSPIPLPPAPSTRVAVVVPRTFNATSSPDDDENDFYPSRLRVTQIQGPPVWVVNHVDSARLPLDFNFINDYVFRQGTSRLAPEARYGCSCPVNNGRDVGCEYVQNCDCLDDATDQDGKRLGFPYHAVGDRKGCLRNLYLETRYAIYECNELCTCPDRCKNKVVSSGRQIPFEIFRTKDRGWGLRSTVPIIKGQFIDTYRGEVITDAEATRRENQAGKGKDSYLFSLDKFSDLVPDDELFVVDGETLGGPTRFINHSCDPNCRQFAVSRYRGDPKVYELAFFALEDIPAYRELTFNYVDDDEEDEDEGLQGVSDGNIGQKEKEKGRLATKCLCGSRNCKKYLWL